MRIRRLCCIHGSNNIAINSRYQPKSQIAFSALQGFMPSVCHFSQPLIPVVAINTSASHPQRRFCLKEITEKSKTDENATVAGTP
ncbi:hypothetical protein ETK21_18575 [Shigella sonnei]|nr:hypothetical protein [Shigella sonnei]EFX7269305.1 hypothetical protein [Shigella sonnei]EFX7273706.1 hypothetical protein [Shigella sonnei]EFX7385336.1 hypothetical protein [Shigella sonnei]EFX7816123.1 hypothetical protein [Shigella sonnei]